MRKILVIGIIIALSAATLYRIFFNLFHQPTQRWDEQTNINVVTDSLSRKSFPVLYLDNEPFFEKPPLWYMTTAIATEVTQQPILVLRLVSALFGIGVILLTVILAWRWWGAVAGITAWIVLLASNHLFTKNAGGYFSSHTFYSADIDTMQIFFIMIAFGACVHMTSNSLMPILAGIATGLAILTKGPLGMIPLVAATLLFMRHKKSTTHPFFTAWATTVVVALPWYLYMTTRFGLPFLSAHFGYHIVGRALSPIEGHNLPPWYYLQLLGNHAVFFSWELLVGSTVWVIFKKLYRDPKVLYIFMLMGAFLIVPTLIRTRLAWYLFPFYPFAALITGITADDIVKRFKKNL